MPRQDLLKLNQKQVCISSIVSWRAMIIQPGRIAKSVIAITLLFVMWL